LPIITLLDPNDSRAFRNNDMSAMMRARAYLLRTRQLGSLEGRVLARAASQASTGLTRAKKKELPSGKFYAYMICRV
jgi:hypothetical protein